MSGPAATARPGAPRRPRRHDPGRRDRLIDAALTVIAERGVAGTTHREIARAADVPLGSMTYHFGSLNEVLAEAFTRHADSVAGVFDERLATARDLPAAVEAVITLLTEDRSAPGTTSSSPWSCTWRRPATRC